MPALVDYNAVYEKVTVAIAGWEASIELTVNDYNPDTPVPAAVSIPGGQWSSEESMQRTGDAAMPCVQETTGHREINDPRSWLRLPACVAKPVTKARMVGNKEAMDAYWEEWSNLEAKGVWSWDSLSEWDDVAAKAKAEGTEVHFGYLFGFMVIKGDEFNEGDPRRRWKYRIVFQGNEVKDQDWQVALFQQLATAPATLEAARVAEIYSCLPGHSVEVQDVEQAYISADLGGVPTYVQLPKELWTPAITKCDAQWSSLRKPCMVIKIVARTGVSTATGS